MICLGSSENKMKYTLFFSLVYSVISIVVISCDSSVNVTGKKDIIDYTDTGSSNDNFITDYSSTEDREAILDLEEEDIYMDIAVRDGVNDIWCEDITDITYLDVAIKDTNGIEEGFACTNPCDCPDGYICEGEKCKYWRDVFGPYIFCCLHNECLPGSYCIYPNGKNSTCNSNGDVGIEIGIEDSNVCIPNCSGKLCGEDDGCGGKCSDCVEVEVFNGYREFPDFAPYEAKWYKTPPIIYTQACATGHPVLQLQSTPQSTAPETVHMLVKRASPPTIEDYQRLKSIRPSVYDCRLGIYVPDKPVEWKDYWWQFISSASGEFYEIMEPITEPTVFYIMLYNDGDRPVYDQVFIVSFNTEYCDNDKYCDIRYGGCDISTHKCKGMP